jgi:hypothetical protein
MKGFTMNVLMAICVLPWSACSYRDTVGRTGDVPAVDSGFGCDGTSCTEPTDCSNFVIPSGDCSLGHGACNFDSDCSGLNESCNGGTGRCYLATDNCVGTPCRIDGDCASSERCNMTSGTCFELAASQRCMPCFLLSVDCGGQTCDDSLEICL